MKSISSVSVMISMLLINQHFNNVKGGNHECIPEGACYYDISVNQTKQSQCRKTGESWVYIYNGNNGCDMKHFHSVFKSSTNNQCCNIDPEIVGNPCDDVYDCTPYEGANAEYCGSQGHCESPNTCINNGMGNGPHCSSQNDCNGACICDGLGGSQGIGICVPVGNLADESTQYSVTVINKAGETIDVGIFQENPSDEIYKEDGLLPIVFASQGISDNGQATFSWELEWGLSWSSGTNNDCTEFSSGIIYSQSGEIVSVSPTDPDNNGAIITYDEENSVWDINKSPDSSLDNGLIVKTDNSFSNQDASKKCFTVCVTMNSNAKQTPIFAVPGIPNNEYSFKLKPKYYISRVSTKAGQTVSEQSTSSAYGPIEFNNNNQVTLCINDKNAFEECQNEDLLK